MDAFVAGNLISLVLVQTVYLCDFSLCILYLLWPISGLEGYKPRGPWNVKVIGTSGAYLQQRDEPLNWLYVQQ